MVTVWPPCRRMSAMVVTGDWVFVSIVYDLLRLVIPTAVSEPRVLISVRAGRRDLVFSLRFEILSEREVPRPYSGAEDSAPSSPGLGMTTYSRSAQEPHLSAHSAATAAASSLA